MRAQTMANRNAASQDPGPGGRPGRGSEFRPHRRRPQGRTPSRDLEGARSRRGPQVGTALGRYRGGHIGPVGPPPIARCERGCDPLSTTHQSGERCASDWLIHPLRFRCDMGLRMRTRTVEAGRADGHQYSHTLVTVGKSLAREPDLPEEIALIQHFEFGPGHLLVLALQIFYSAGGAPGVTTTAVQDIHPGILFDGQDQSLVLW